MNGSILRAGILAAAVALLGCDAKEPEGEPTMATVRLELETATANGNVFQLRDAVFKLAGPITTAVTSDGIGPFVSVNVPPGDYSIKLTGAWHLDHTSGPGAAIDTSDAVLLSANPMFVTVPAGVVTGVVFKFGFGKDQLTQNGAQVHIGIEVDEPLCGNGLLDPGEECDYAIPYPNSTCDALCTGGDKPCTDALDCSSAICTGGSCPECDSEASSCSYGCDDDDVACVQVCSDSSNDCTGACEDGEASCRDTCGNLSAVCWASCWFDPIGCSLTCEPARTLCMDQCSTDASGCSSSCETGYTACKVPCASAHDMCLQGCDEAQDTCWDACRTCAPCTEAGQCPLYGQ